MNKYDKWWIIMKYIEIMMNDDIINDEWWINVLNNEI